jgi:SAM-dependent methyltransferase
MPPTPLGDGAFDLIFAVSVFTHLDETMQFALLGEMRRLLRPGGVLVASVQGEHHRSLRKRQFDLSSGFAFVAGDRGWFKKDGLPRFYQDAQHTRGYVEREWAKYLDVVLYRDRGIADHQDAVVLTRS